MEADAVSASDKYRKLKLEAIGPYAEDGFDQFVMPLLDLLEEHTNRIRALEARLGESQTIPTPE